MRTIIFLLLLVLPQSKREETVIKDIITKCLIANEGRMKIQEFRDQFGPSKSLDARLDIFQLYFDDILHELEPNPSYEVYKYSEAVVKFPEITRTEKAKNLYVVKMRTKNGGNAYVYMYFKNGLLFSLLPIAKDHIMVGWI